MHFTMFFGVSHEKASNGIFSFVPVIVPNAGNGVSASGYPRFTITKNMVSKTQYLKGLTFENLRGVKTMEVESSVCVWKEIAKLAEDNGYCLGTHFDEQ